MNLEFVEAQNQFGSPCTIKDILSLKNQSFARTLIDSIKCIAKKWEIHSHERDELRDQRTHQIASAYYLNQLP